MTGLPVRRALALAVPMLAAVLVACAASADTAPRTAPATTERRVQSRDLIIVAEDTIAEGILLSGSLSAVRRAALRAETAAPVAAVHVRVGERVARGQLLVELRVPAAASARLASDAAVTSARRQQQVAQVESERTAALFRAGGASRSEVEAADLRMHEAAALLAEAEARQQTAREEQARARITAPFSGVVAARRVNDGDVVQPGDSLLDVVDPSRYELEADVPVHDLRAIRLGQRVALTIAGLPGEPVTGVLARRAPAVDPATRLLRVAVELPAGQAGLIAGAFAEGHLQTGRRMGVTVPRAALLLEGSDTAVVRLRAGRTERLAVQLVGRTDGARVALAGAIRAGDTLLTGPMRTLPAGTTVQIKD